MSINLYDLPASMVIRPTLGLHHVLFDVPIRTITAANAREHYAARARRVKGERLALRRAMAGLRVPALPIVVTFTRLSPRLCDDDGLPTAAKGLRDEIAALYGTGDSPTHPIRWQYRQEKRLGKPIGMTVEIAADARSSPSPGGTPQ